jgi:hypothetical protein
VKLRSWTAVSVPKTLPRPVVSIIGQQFASFGES